MQKAAESNVVRLRTIPVPHLHTRPIPFLLSYALRRRWAFLVLLALICAAATSAVGVQYGMKLVVDAMSTGDRQDPGIWHWLRIFIALIALESVLWRLAGIIGCRTIVATGVDIRLDLFRHLSGHPLRYFSRHLSGALGSRVTSTAGSVGAIVGTLTWKIVPPCIDFIGAVVVLCTVDVRMALALIGFAVVVGATITAFGVRGRPLHQTFARESARVGGDVTDVVANMWTVKAFSARDREYRRLQGAFGIEAKAQRHSWMYLEKARVMHDVCLWLMAGGMLGWAIHSWQSGAATPGDVVVISALTFRILHGSRDFALALVEASQHFGVIGEMLDVVAGANEVADAPGARDFRAGRGDIRLENVSFSYENGHKVFSHFNLYVPGGQKVGIVGPSGAGKSTLIALLQRLDDVSTGRIVIDGQPIASVRQDSLRDAIAVVPQEISLLHRSVADNIRVGRPLATHAEVVTAAREAACHDFIEALPDGYDTVVGERGAKVSGGQRQRIGLARAFLKNAPILLLDEATSALDSESESEVQASLERLMRGRTVIAVAHRLSTLSSFDRIVVVDGGRIVQDGPPSELQEDEGMFSTLWRLQTGGARETA